MAPMPAWGGVTGWLLRAQNGVDNVYRLARHDCQWLRASGKFNGVWLLDERWSRKPKEGDEQDSDDDRSELGEVFCNPAHAAQGFQEPFDQARSLESLGKRLLVDGLAGLGQLLHQGHLASSSLTLLSARRTPARILVVEGNTVRGTTHQCHREPLQLGQRDAVLSLVFTLLVRVRHFANVVFIGLEEEHLRDPFICIDLGW